MSSSERLPSFKGPRDLSLSSRGAKRETAGTAPAHSRPRRVFTPNIPPKRDRSATTASSAPTLTSTTTPKDVTATNSGNIRGRPPRGRGNIRGTARPVKQRAELLQSESIFSDGVGDPMDARRNPSMQYRSGYGSSRYRGSMEGGSSRMSSMNRTTLNTLIKEERDESDKKIFGNERFEQVEEDEANAENPNTPVILPLIGYVPELFMGPTTCELEAASTNIHSEQYPVPGTSKESVPLVKIKEEKIDDDDLPTPTTILNIKKEKLDDDTEKEFESSRAALAAMSLDPSTFAGTFRSTPKDGTLVYFQFPDELPVLEGSIRESVDQQDTTKNSADLVKDIDDLPEGFIGRLQILSNGRTRFIIGENSFDVEPGRPLGFRQELLSLDLDHKTLTNLGPVNRKFVLAPDIACLINDAL